MEDVKDLQEMARNGEVSKKLLEDENFKSELKKIMKEESGVEITDEQIPEIIKNFEKALQDENILEESELEDVSGGVKRQNDYQLSGGDKARVVGTAVGAVLGAIGGVSLGMVACDDPTKQIKKENKRRKKIRMRNRIDAIYDKEFGTYTYHRPEALETGPIHTLGEGGAVLGAGLGFGVTHLFCKALNI